MRRQIIYSAVLVGVLGIVGARGEFLFNSFLTPSFAGAPNTQYSAWDVMYSPFGEPNFPDFAAPYGDYETATVAGFTPPANSSPGNPLAFWDSRNPTITQTGTNTAFIIGPGSTGNIYSFAEPLSYQIANTTPFTLGTVVLQFQTDGTLTDFSSIQLRYTNSSGQVISLSPSEMLREYESSGSSFGGTMNRTAVEWNLAGLGITSYQIVWNSQSSSSSLQEVTLDTSANSTPVIPPSRSWNAASGNWSDGTKWREGSSSNENGNVNFINTATGTVTLDGNHTVGQLTFNTVADTTINSPGGFTLTANTGISTTALATGTYTINSNYQFGAYNVFDIEAGTVILAGAVSGNNGLEKLGGGTLNLTHNNNFTGPVTVNAGTLRLAGTNNYTGSTAVLFGTLIVAADAPASGAGALGNATSNVTVGADSATFANVGGGSAQLLIEGNHTVGRNITLANGTFDKTLGAQNTTTGATFSGTVDLGTSNSVHLKATSVTDTLIFSGGIVNGSSVGSVLVDGAGTVTLAGVGESYAYTNATSVSSGTLRIESGVSFTGNGNVSVGNGATLLVHGALNGSGTLTLNGGTLGGSGAVNRQFTLDTGDVLSPGINVGTLSTVNERWAGGGTLRLQIEDANGIAGSGWDNIAISGGLSLTASAGNPFKLQLQSLTALNAPGLVFDFNSGGSYSWKFLTTTTAISGFDPSQFSIDTSGFQNALNGTFNVALAADGKGLVLNYLAVPEPTSGLLMASGILVLLKRRRRAPQGR